MNLNLERTLQTPGWMSEEELRYLARAAGKSSRICEVGSWMGRSSRAIADNTLGRLTCVDTWLGGEEQGGEADVMQDFLANTADLTNIEAVRLPSEAAASRFAFESRTFDMIFIDARHAYENVRADIAAWMPLLAEGGIFCGHDYHVNWPGVVQAVRELVPRFRVVGTIWTTEVA